MLAFKPQLLSIIGEVILMRKILPDVPDIKVPIKTQIQNLQRWNKQYKLGLRWRDLFWAKHWKVHWPQEPQDAWQAVVVYFCLESPYETLKAWQRILGFNRGRPVIPRRAEDIRIQPDVFYRPGIHFGVVDLSAFWNRGYQESEDSPRSVVNAYPECSPHFAVLAAVAQLQEWRAHLGNPFPYVFVPGIQIKPPEKGWDQNLIYSLIVNIRVPRERSWERRINLDIVPECSQWCETYAIPQIVAQTA